MASCNCPERDKPAADRAWEIEHYKCDFAPPTYKRKKTKSSTVACKACGVRWRSSAGFVDELRDRDSA